MVNRAEGFATIAEVLQCKRYKKEGCIFQVRIRQERHIQFYLPTVTTQQDFDVFIDVVTCINQDSIRF